MKYLLALLLFTSAYAQPRQVDSVAYAKTLVRGLLKLDSLTRAKLALCDSERAFLDIHYRACLETASSAARRNVAALDTLLARNAALAALSDSALAEARRVSVALATAQQQARAVRPRRWVWIGVGAGAALLTRALLAP